MKMSMPSMQIPRNDPLADITHEEWMKRWDKLREEMKVAEGVEEINRLRKELLALAKARL